MVLGGLYMKKYGIIVICSLFLISTIGQVVYAGDELDPEIDDPESDVLLFGLMPAPFVNHFMKHIDILSGWFHEDVNNPDTIYTTLKFRDYKPCKLLVIYAIFWYYNDSSYAAFAMMARGKDYLIGVQINDTNLIEIDDMYTINQNNNTITFAIPKELIGNPQPGEMLENPFGLAAIRFVSDSLANLLIRFVSSNILFADLTFNGMDYQIQY